MATPRLCITFHDDAPGETKFYLANHPRNLHLLSRSTSYKVFLYSPKARLLGRFGEAKGLTILAVEQSDNGTSFSGLFRGEDVLSQSERPVSPVRFVLRK
mmetsp:Transcript_38347/g.151576  ORF Transcript_38347/g.151576 Transcript_38347/m.151576 type:complete len:100 (+) Transcript_38347:1418-1717(+)